MFGWRRNFWLGLLLTWGGVAHGGEPQSHRHLENTESSARTPAEPTGDEKGGGTPSDNSESEPSSFKPNLKIKTLGGVQFWGDVAYYHGWHIQRNVFTGHHRLLDAHDVRFAWGTREQCETRLEEIREEEELAPLPKTAVIILHGLGRSDKSVSRLKRHFEKAGYYTIAMNYPSLRASVQQNAEYLHAVLQSLDGVEQVHLVGFSMGGIVIRQCLAAQQEPRLGRVVFIGTPNQGAELASMLKDWWAFKTITGQAGQDLAMAPHGVAAKLPAPSCEFGIIAGCRGTDAGYNPLIPGDNDGTVSLETTRLAGASDFMTVRGIHQVLLNTPSVCKAAEHFIAHGRFDPDRDPSPILVSERAPEETKPQESTVRAASARSSNSPEERKTGN